MTTTASRTVPEADATPSGGRPRLRTVPRPDEWRQRYARWKNEDHEAFVSDTFQEYVEHGSPGLGYFTRRPAEAGLMLASLLSLPQLQAAPSLTSSGWNLRTALPRGWFPLRLVTHRALLVLPDSVAAYMDGSSKQTLRRKVRAAQKQGITWRAIPTGEEKRSLLQQSQDWENSLPQSDMAGSDNTDLLNYPLWLAAFSKDGAPLLLSVTPVDGDWAALRLFRTIGAGPEQSNARYLMMQVLAGELIERRVRYLVDAVVPARLGNGLRHFQRMLGFRIFRVRVR